MTSPANLLEMLEQSVQVYGNRTALNDPNEHGGYDSWTYHDLWEDIRKTAGKLRELGINSDDKVGLIAESRAFWPICDFAIMSNGACTVPVYPSLPHNQIEHIISHAQMQGIFVQNMKQLKKLVDCPLDAFPDLKFVVLLENPEHGQLLDEAHKRWVVEHFRVWRQQGAVIDEVTWKKTWQPLTRDTLATIVYTSGTTGLPKGAMLSHGNLLANVEGIRGNVFLDATDRSLSYLPLSHIFERTAGQLVSMQAGGSITYSRGIDAIVEDFKKMPPVVLTTVPRLLEKVLERVSHQVEAGPTWKKKLFHKAIEYGVKARIEKKPVNRLLLSMYDKLVFKKIHEATGGQLRLIVSGGAPLPFHVGRFFTAAGFTVLEGYGMTETAPVVAVNPPDDVRLGTVGRVLKNLDVRIAEDGEVLVKGPSVMMGYYRDEASTRETIEEDGWLHTGDIGELSDDRYLKITDRKKNLLVLSTGKKVTPAPIETVILSNKYIDQVLLIGQGRKYVSAIVVPSDAAMQLWLSETGLAGLTLAEYREQNAVQAFLLRQIEETVKDFARFEQPKKIIIAREPFSIENEQLTPSLKVRARDVTRVYKCEIDELYGDE